jgi:hypothetical protein
MNPEDINIDDIVTNDDLQEALDSMREDIESEMPEFDADEFHPDPAEFQEVADRTFMERLQHLANEDCDTEACNRLRDEFGIGPADDHDHDHDEADDADADADEPDETPEDDTGGSTEWEADENIFGEKV